MCLAESHLFFRHKDYKANIENHSATAHISSSFGYSRFDRRLANLAATFMENPYDFCHHALLNSIRNVSSNLICQYAINRTINQTIANGFSNNINMPVAFYLHVFGTISLKGNFAHSASKTNNFEQKLTLSSVTHGHLNHGVDLIAKEGATSATTSSVNTWWATERLTLNYSIGKNSIVAKGYIGVSHVSAKRLNFESYNLCDFNYGLTPLINLPWPLQLSTDLTMYSRFYFNYSHSNSNKSRFYFNYSHSNFN